MLPILIGTAATSGLLSIVFFILYVRARMKEQPEEEFYQRVHFLSLFILFALGIVIMFYMSATFD
ncbi:hypothetical protein SAMN05444008_11424 [Cnuella takakiae]|uniref:Uncharacterized protein n=1 Tax=Cnuella takakiae TaxID=1302690 RepID=A0A1M5FIG6_9BACT|nr:hypothetical protein [Cnuella takakiae]OLY93754.1 hypothetical protein BUE76_19085 [Cnuella takakiae]SHF91367.1 hypothetical protein SAMN05444008_11424 [Cnuella takakiae]